MIFFSISAGCIPFLVSYGVWFPISSGIQSAHLMTCYKERANKLRARGSYLLPGNSTIQKDSAYKSIAILGKFVFEYFKQFTMSISRKLITKQTPRGEPGFLGRGHIARAVINTDFKDSDPFILMMDDMLDKKD